MNRRQEIYEDAFEALLIKINEEKHPDMLVLGIEIHCTMRHFRNGVLIGYSRHAGTLTTLGKNYIEDQISDSPSATMIGDDIGLSNSTDSPSAAWTSLPDEITTGDMGRADGTYANVGDGQWNVTKSFSPSESNSTRLVGLYYNLTGNYLLASDTITVVNYQSGDTVEITWTVTVS